MNNILKIILRIYFILLFTIFYGCDREVMKSYHSNVVKDSFERDGTGYFLPKGLIKITLKKSEQKEGEYQLNIEPKFIPDKNHYYLFKYYRSVFAHDKITVGVTQDGFLDYIDIEPEDKLVAIADKVIATAKEIAKIFVPVPKANIVKLEVEPTIELIIDPDNDAEIKDAEKKLKEKIKGLDFALKRPFKDGAGKEQSLVTSGPADQKGIYYRPLVPYKLTIGVQPNQATNDPGFLLTKTILLPNGAPIMAVDLTGVYFINKHTTLNFRQGILTQVKIVKPSEIEAGLDIPLAVVRAIIALPTELIQFQIDTSQTKTGYYQAQLDELKAKDAIIKYLKDKKDKNE